MKSREASVLVGDGVVMSKFPGKPVRVRDVSLIMGDPVVPGRRLTEQEVANQDVERERELEALRAERELRAKQRPTAHQIRLRATLSYAQALHWIAQDIEGRELSNGAFATWYLACDGISSDAVSDWAGEVKETVDRIRKQVRTGKFISPGTSDSTLASRWHKYRDGDNASLQGDLARTGERIGAILRQLMLLEHHDVEHLGTDASTSATRREHARRALGYLSGYREYNSVSSRYAYQLNIAADKWLDEQMGEQTNNEFVAQIVRRLADDDSLRYFAGLRGSDLSALEKSLRKRAKFPEAESEDSPRSHAMSIVLRRLLRRTGGKLRLQHLADLAGDQLKLNESYQVEPSTLVEDFNAKILQMERRWISLLEDRA